MYTEWKKRAEWLQQQAGQAYVWDDEFAYWRVKETWHHPHYDVTPSDPLKRDRLSDCFSDAVNNPAFYLSGNLALNKWPHLPGKTQERLDQFLEDHDYGDISYFDKGGRAMAFKAIEKATGRMRIVRLEAPHASRSAIRPDHPTILQPYLTNRGEIERYEGMLLEVFPEVVPLYKLPDRLVSERYSDHSVYSEFQSAIWHIAHGTNLTYSEDLYDMDSEPSNVGILPDGKVVSYDQEFEVEERRFKCHREMREALMPDSDAMSLYGMAPNARFFG